jgi:xylulokinase
MDYRGAKQVRALTETFGAKELFERTGMEPHPLNSLPKIMWMRENNAGANVWKYTTYADFILGKLGSDDLVIDLSMASRTMALDIAEKKWRSDILEFARIDESSLSKPLPSGTGVGYISGALADELGISRKAMLVTGGHDQTCAALGAGLIRENLSLDSHGTAEVLSAALNAPHLNDTMFESFYPCYCHAVKGMYFTFALNHTAGILLKWFSEQFVREEPAKTDNAKESVYEVLMNHLPEGPTNLLFLPHFNGSGTPSCDLSSKGALLGLTLATTRFDIAKAILESLAMEMRLNLETMRKADIKVDALRCVGGGAKNPKGLQLKADICGLPVSTLKVREAACFGAAILAGLGSGAYESAEEAALCVKINETIEPREAYAKTYNEKYRIYAQKYEALMLMQHDL